MPHDVFVSYSTKDKPVADALTAALEAAGVRCWIAPRDIVPGAEWGEAIIDAIASCRILVLIFSAHSNVSPQVRREVDRAVGLDVHIIPFRIDLSTPSKSMEYAISTPHWLEAMSGPMEAHLRRLTATVKHILSPPLEPLPPTPPAAGRVPRQRPDAARPAPGGKSPALWAIAGAAVALLIAVGAFWALRGGESREVAKGLPAPPASLLTEAPTTRPKTVAPPLATTGPRLPQAATLPARPPAATQDADKILRVVDLLPLIDPDRDPVSGSWKKENGLLVGGAGDSPIGDPKLNKICIPYKPPQEYDFRINFTRLTGKGDVVQMQSSGRGQFAWLMGAKNNTVLGLEPVDNKAAFDDFNITKVKQIEVFKNGASYSAEVRVRAPRVTALIDGRVVCDYPTDYSNFSTRGDSFWLVPAELGLGTYDSQTVFNKVEVAEIFGQGSAIARTPPDARLVRTFIRHDYPVNSISFSPDNRRMLSSTSGNQKDARLWEVTTGKQLGGRYSGYAAKMLPDGRRFLAGGIGWRSWLYDAENGKPLYKISDIDVVRSCAFSPDGLKMAICTEVLKLEIRNTLDGTQAVELPDLKEVSAENVAFSADGKYLATTTVWSESKPLCLWDGTTGKKLWQRQTTQLQTPYFSTDGKRVAAMSDRQNRVVLLDAKDGAVVREWKEKKPPNRIAFTPDGRALLVATGEPGVALHLYDAANGEELSRFSQAPATGPIKAVAYSPDGKKLLAGGDDRLLHLLDADTGREIDQFTGHDRAVSAATFTPDGQCAVSGSEDGLIRMFRLPEPVGPASQPAPATRP